MSLGTCLLFGIILGLLFFIKTKADDNDQDGVL